MLENVVEKNSASTDVISNVFNVLRVKKGLAQDVRDGWAGYFNSAPSRKAAGEAIYVALFDSAPSLQGLSKAPRAVMAMRVTNDIGSILADCRILPR